MVPPTNHADLPHPPILDGRSAYEWRHLSGQVLYSRSQRVCANVNVTLLDAANREPQSPLAPLYRLWMADNYARDGRFADALAVYDQCLDCAQAAPQLFDQLDPRAGALLHKAQAARLADQPSVAIATYQDLAELDPSDANPLFQAGLVAELQNDADRAAELYRAVASRQPSRRADDPAELARRALNRLSVPSSAFAQDSRRLADDLVDALGRRDAEYLRGILSTTHFAAGPVGGHASFETGELVDELCRDLLESTVSCRRTLLGSGEKLYLQTSGWKGTWFSGDLILMITKAPRGWQWTGLAIAQPGDRWLDRWRPTAKATNQPLPFELSAPWPAGQSFAAGGLNQYIAEQAAVVAAGFLGGFFLAAGFATRRCGFGPRGYHYNQGSTHDEEDAFAIDFTRYRRFVPYDFESGGTPVLAAREGIVRQADAGTPSGSSSASNTVAIVHADPGNPNNLERFRSRYLHLEGPFRIPVSVGMQVFEGNRVGLIDDTGDSVLDHLHFSIHDRQIPHPNSPFGASVRPTPMSGVRLEDGDSGPCVLSTNAELIGAKPMIEPTGFAGQNFLITPTASAVNQTPPAAIKDQTWLLVLSGVAIVDLQGNSAAQPRRETVLIRPDLSQVLQGAIDKFGIPTPPPAFITKFQVEQIAPFATLSSVFNKDQSINSGFAVEVWRANPLITVNDAFTNAPISNVFDGIQIDVAVQDTDAFIRRVSFQIVLVGKIVFTINIIL